MQSGRSKKIKIKLSVRPSHFIMLFLITLETLSPLTFIGKLSIFGRPISTYAEYLISLISIIYVFLYITPMPHRRSTAFTVNLAFGIMAYILVSTAISIIYGSSFVDVLAVTRFYFPCLCVAYYVLLSGLDEKKCHAFLYFLSFILGLLTVLSTLGFLSGMVTGSGSFLRSSSDVDGSFGVFTSVIFLDDILSNKTSADTRIKYAGFIFSIVIVCFSFSRARIMIMVILLALYMIENSKMLGSKKGLLFVIVILFAIIIFRDSITTVLAQIQRRLSRNIATDNNIIYRLEEAKLQIEIWKQRFILGNGWGSREKYSVFGRERLYDHCSFTSVLMYTGVSGFLFFFFPHIRLYFKSLKYQIKKIKNTSVLRLLIVALFCLGIASEGFNKMSAVIVCMYMATLNVKYENEISNFDSNERMI